MSAKNLKRLQWQRAGIFAGVFALVGVTLLLATHAATPTASLEAELGTKTGVTTTADATASGGSYVQFNTTTQPSGNCSGTNLALPSGATYPTGTTKLIFDDEFDANTLGSCWKAPLQPGGANPGQEEECMIPANASITSGTLRLLAKKDSTSCSGYQYTSATVYMTPYKFLFGTIEFRMLSSGGTTWPAAWALEQNCQNDGYSCNWPNPGSSEVDIAEFLGSQFTSVNQQLHTASGSPGCTPTVSNASQNWHVYDLVWSSGKLVFKIDGTTTCTLTQGVQAQNMFMIFDVALGFAGGTVNPATLPQTLQVDYVRVFQ